MHHPVSIIRSPASNQIILKSAPHSRWRPPFSLRGKADFHATARVSRPAEMRYTEEKGRERERGKKKKKEKIDANNCSFFSSLNPTKRSSSHNRFVSRQIPIAQSVKALFSPDFTNPFESSTRPVAVFYEYLTVLIETPRYTRSRRSRIFRACNRLVCLAAAPPPERVIFVLRATLQGILGMPMQRRRIQESERFRPEISTVRRDAKWVAERNFSRSLARACLERVQALELARAQAASRAASRKHHYSYPEEEKERREGGERRSGGRETY